MSDHLFPINQTEYEHQHCAYNHTTSRIFQDGLPVRPLSTGKHIQGKLHESLEHLQQYHTEGDVFLWQTVVGNQTLRHCSVLT